MTERMRTAVPLIAGLLLVAAAVVVFFASARTPAEPAGAMPQSADSGPADMPGGAAVDTPPPDTAPPRVRADTPPRPAPASATAADSLRRDSLRRDSARRDSAARRGTPIGDPAALPRPPVTLPRPSPDSAGESR